MKPVITFSILALLLVVTGPVSAFSGISGIMEGTIDNISENVLEIISSKGDELQIVEVKINEETYLEDKADLEILEKGDKVTVEYVQTEEGLFVVSIGKVLEDRQLGMVEQQL